MTLCVCVCVHLVQSNSVLLLAGFIHHLKLSFSFSKLTNIVHPHRSFTAAHVGRLVGCDTETVDCTQKGY